MKSAQEIIAEIDRLTDVLLADTKLDPLGYGRSALQRIKTLILESLPTAKECAHVYDAMACSKCGELL